MSKCNVVKYLLHGLVPFRRAGRVLTCLLLLSGVAHAQGIERESIAGEASAEASSGANFDNQPYNLKIGPVELRASAGISTSYNDNINVADTGRLNDFILAPFLDLHGNWQATELNALTFDIGVAYQEYLKHSSYSNFLISPDSRTQFNVFVGDFKINFHDDFSFQDDPIQVGQLSNTSQFTRFSNDGGVLVNWDLGDVVPSIGYDHNTFFVLEDQYKYLDRQQDVLSPSFTFNVTKTLQTGLRTWFQTSYYEQHIENDNRGVSGGPFVTAEFTDNLSLTAQAGWIYTDYDQNGTNGDHENANTYYGSLGINHRINDYLTETLSAGREVIPGLTSNFTRRTYADYTAILRVNNYLTATPNLWYEHLDDSDALFHEDADRFGAGLNISYAISDHLALNAAYQYVVKSSNPSFLDYYQDLVVLSLRYSF